MSNLHHETIEYSANGSTMKGYLAYDASKPGERPGVMVIHEWWGLDDYIRRRADMLAEMGYTALAVDMYGDGKTGNNPDEAGALMNAVLGDMETGTARIKAAYDCLTSQTQTDASNVAAIGYCFGGAMVLHAARIGMDLKSRCQFSRRLGFFS